MADWNGDSVNDHWPLFYDNYFVPRGYAYILAQMNGTGYTENGCPMHGGPGDIAGEKSVIDWLNGRVKPATAPRPAPPPRSRDWHNGTSAHDRQVLRRHAVQRRGRHGRRRPQDDRPDLGDSAGTTTRAPAASGTTRTTRRQPEPDAITGTGRPNRPASNLPTGRRSARRSTTTSPTTPMSTPATATGTATSTRSGAIATTTRTSARSRPPSSRPTASRTTTSAWTTWACGGTG